MFTRGLLVLRLLFLGLFCLAQLAWAQTPTPAAGGEGPIYVDVGAAGSRKFRMAVSPFVAQVGVGVKPEELVEWTKRLESLFEFTGSFDVQPGSGFVAKPDAALRLPLWEEWSAIRSEGVIFSKVIPASGSQFSLEMRFFDVGRQKRLVGKLFSSLERADVDRALRRFADLCVEALTGELGIFSTKIAFVGTRKAGENKQVFITNFDGTELTQITDGNAINMSPSWSPDGQKLTFTSFRDGHAEIYRYDVLTRKLLRLTRSQGNSSGAAWHPNGKTVAFSSAVEGKTSIFTIRALDGGDRKSLVEGSGLEVEPAYSPDGNLLAFASGRFGNPHIFVRELASGKDTRITTAGWYNSSPAWRPDGRKLAFAGYDREIDRYDIFIVNPDGSQMERLTLNQGDNEKPSWSPDGRFILFQSNRSGGGKRGYKLFVMNRDGGSQTPLKIPLHEVTMPAWGPRVNLLGE